MTFGYYLRQQQCAVVLCRQTRDLAHNHGNLKDLGMVHHCRDGLQEK